MLSFVPQTPLASPVGDAARISRGTRPTQWLPNLQLQLLNLNEVTRSRLIN
ncbi:MAG: hypothetical protein RM368_10715 [Nostoc sp. DedSLP03]|uniref:hypothetical protein n=1 Tax=Nostoc sp. DedSLP03 TaxID=3075400 RepID=UPI002AD45065|nr:hypothetical protein [Nostoc sp. DedSLP03]MDZ7965434.1 hypothetical protein [Nostoc sp. DedSLP03]